MEHIRTIQLTSSLLSTLRHGLKDSHGTPGVVTRKGAVKRDYRIRSLTVLLARMDSTWSFLTVLSIPVRPGHPPNTSSFRDCFIIAHP